MFWLCRLGTRFFFLSIFSEKVFIIVFSYISLSVELVVVYRMSTESKKSALDKNSIPVAYTKSYGMSKIDYKLQRQRRSKKVRHSDYVNEDTSIYQVAISSYVPGNIAFKNPNCYQESIQNF